MKWSVWVANSWLVILFLLVAGTNVLLKQESPRFKKKTARMEPLKKKAPVSLNLEKIFQNDLFDTFKFREIQPTKKNLVTPIPQLKAPVFSPPPEVKKPQLLPPLNISLKGIILSSNADKSVAMITDATNKEGIYHIGAKIQDAQVIKISRNRTVLLRSNGQQEVLYLRKEDNKLTKKPEERWKFVVKKIDDKTFELDPIEFKKEVESLGEMIEALSLSTAFKAGKPIGIKVGTLDPNNVGPVLGLAKNDIITAINGISTTDMRNRLDIYDAVSVLGRGDAVGLTLKRNNAEMNITYNLKKLERPLKTMLTSGGVGPTPAAPGKIAALPQSQQQKREESQRKFMQTHPSTHQQTIEALRKRLLENMKQRSRNMRVR